MMTSQTDHTYLLNHQGTTSIIENIIDQQCYFMELHPHYWCYSYLIMVIDSLRIISHMLVEYLGISNYSHLS